MELDTNQAFNRALAAHKAGKLQEAEYIYRQILEAIPSHPDANHNLGVLAVSVNKIDMALPFFKTATEVNPKIEQYWLSYINALIECRHLSTAKAILQKVERLGFVGEKLAALALKISSVAVKPETIGSSPSQEHLSKFTEYYKAGRYRDAEKLAEDIIKEFPEHVFGWKVLAAVLKQTDRKSEALDINRKALERAPQDAEVYNNIGVLLKDLGRLEEAETNLRQALEFRNGLVEAHHNLGAVLQQLGRMEEAEASYRNGLDLQPNNVTIYFTLANFYLEINRFNEAQKSFSQIIKLDPGNSEAYNNLGIILQKLKRFGEARESFAQATVLKAGCAEFYKNLGNLLKDQDKLEDAKDAFERALILKTDYAEAFADLGVVYYAQGEIDSAINSLEKACDIDPVSKTYDLLLVVVRARKLDRGRLDFWAELADDPIILEREVESELVCKLFEMQSREMEKAEDTPVFGNGTCSIDYRMLDDDNPILRTLENDLVSAIKQCLKSDIFIIDSFFNIYGSGAGIPPHTHLSELDNEKYFQLAKQKYSLVYYVDVGDQHCSEPGILKLYDPDVEILPQNGMIVIIPASRSHSAVYGGTKKRVIIGINFYCL